MSQYYQDLLIDALLDYGFTLEEALRLIALHERVEESIERRRRQEEERRAVFRWLGTTDVRALLN